MTEIIDIHARQILDSRGNPTVEVDIEKLEPGQRVVERPEEVARERDALVPLVVVLVGLDAEEQDPAADRHPDVAGEARDVVHLDRGQREHDTVDEKRAPITP